MIAYLKGELVIKSIEFIVVETGGIGYKVFMIKSDIHKLDDIGKIEKI